MKNRAPRVQSTWRSLTRKLAVIIRTRLCIQPSATSCRMPASTIGKPVVPSHHARKRSSARLAVVDAHVGHRRVPRAPRRLRPRVEHVGVEVAPRQLLGERVVGLAGGRRGGAAAGGGGGSRSGGTATAGSSRRRPGRRDGRRVVVDAAGDEPVEGAVGGGLAGLGQLGRHAWGRRHAVGAHAVDRRDVARPPDRRRQPVPAPGAEVGAVHLERAATARVQRAGRHGPRAVGLDELRGRRRPARPRPRRRAGARRCRRPATGAPGRRRGDGRRRRRRRPDRRGGRRAGRRGPRRAPRGTRRGTSGGCAPAGSHRASSTTNSGITPPSPSLASATAAASVWLSARRRSRRNHMIELPPAVVMGGLRSRTARGSLIRVRGAGLPRTTHSDARHTRTGQPGTRRTMADAAL